MKRQIKTMLASICTSTISLCMLCAFLPGAKVSALGEKTYYIASDGVGNGLSEATPMSLLQLNETILNGGDTVLFKCGDLFYGSFIPKTYNTSKTNRIEIGSYGGGALPILSNAKIISSPWTQEGAFYSYDLSNTGVYTGVRNDNANVGYVEDSDGVKHGIRRKDASSCTDEYDFYCSGTKIYVKSAQDPFTVLGTLTVNTHANSLIRLSSNLDIHDLHLRDAGYGITWAGNDIQKSNVTISDCIFDNIGGIVIDETNFTKAGNGIELYNSGANVLVEYNLFRDIYDVAFTCQGTTPGVWRDITVRRNLFVDNAQAIEFWCQATAAGTGIYNLSFTENLCINQGEGWGTDVRPNKAAAADILAYTYSAPVWDMTISNNTFFHSGEQGVSYVMPTSTLVTLQSKIISDTNHYYYSSENDIFARWAEGTTAYYYDFEQWKEQTDLDQNSTMTAIGNGTDQQRVLVTMSSESLDFDDIVNMAASAGLYTPIASSNLLSAAALGEGGSQSISGYKYAINGSDLWDLEFSGSFQYGQATQLAANRWPALGTGTVDTLADGNYTGLVQVDFGYPAVGNPQPDYVMSRRLALLIDLGCGSHLDSVTIHMNYTANRIHSVYDYTVYAGNTNNVSVLPSEDYCVGHFSTTQQGSKATLELAKADNVRYVLIIFNKLSTDYGSAGDTAFEDVYGENHLPCSYADGSLKLAEIEINGEENTDAVNLLTTEKLADNMQSITGYQYNFDGSALWDLTYPYSYGTATQLSAVRWPATGTVDKLVDGAYTDNVQIDYGRRANPEQIIARRLALLFDLGSNCDLDSIILYSPFGQYYSVYDCTVYAGNTNNASVLASSEYCIAHYSTMQQSTTAEIELDNIENVRYVLIAFNKLSSDPGSIGSETEGNYGENCLPYSGNPDGTVRLSEIEINGWPVVPVN